MIFLSSRARVALALALLFEASACTPSTQYRHTGYVPAARALAWDGRTAPDGTLRIEGTMSNATVHRNLDPAVGDTALRVPNVMFEGGVFVAASPEVEIGARYAYAAYDWSEPSALGTLSMPSRPSLWGVGPEVRATLPLDKRRELAIGVAANALRYELPYAQWELVKNGQCAPSATCAFDPYAYPPTGPRGAYYTLNGEKSEAHITLNIAVYPSVALGRDGDLGHLFGGFAVHTAFKNDGFANSTSSGSTIQDAGLVYVAGLGYSVALAPLRVSAMLTLPLTTSSAPIDYGPSGFVTVGVDVSLWESRAERRRRLEEEERRRTPSQAPAPSSQP